MQSDYCISACVYVYISTHIFWKIKNIRTFNKLSADLKLYKGKTYALKRFGENLWQFLKLVGYSFPTLKRLVVTTAWW